MNEPDKTGGPLNVFISYSRQDHHFASELKAGLELVGGFIVNIDTEQIHEGEEWKRRLAGLIASADTIVFVLTPRSAASPICKWEIEEAERLSKRILPVQATSLGDVKPPEQLSELHYVRFDERDDGHPRSFVEGLEALIRSLKVDLDWLREHTRLLTRAGEWDSAGRVENRLLSGQDIKEAKKWLESRPTDVPTPTELHRDFIAASDQAESAQLKLEQERTQTLRAALDEAEKSRKIAEDARLAQAAEQKRVVQRTKVGLLLAVLLPISAIPWAGQLYYSIRYGVSYSEVEKYLQQAALFNRNWSCQPKMQFVKTQTPGLHIGVCPKTGDIGVRVKTKQGIRFVWFSPFAN